VPAASQPASDEVVDAWLQIVDAAMRTQHRLLEKVSQSGVSDQWFGVLHLLLRAPEHRMPMTRLARDLSMTAGGFTKLADRMGREGLIDRRGSSGDRRVVYATLTDKGLDEARRGEQAFLEAVETVVLGPLNGKQVLGVAENLARLGNIVAHTTGDEPSVAAVAVRDPDLPDRRQRPRQRTDEPRQADEG
jgi:DNA-binding MarR family transcriptional regulator